MRKYYSSWRVSERITNYFYVEGFTNYVWCCAFDYDGAVRESGVEGVSKYNLSWRVSESITNYLYVEGFV